MHIRFGKPAPLPLARWLLAEIFHWTLDQVDAMKMADLWELSAIDEARGKAKADGAQSLENFRAQGAKV